MPKHQPHTFVNQTDRPAIGLMICTPGGFEGFLREMAAPIPAEGPEGSSADDPLTALETVGARYGMQISAT